MWQKLESIKTKINIVTIRPKKATREKTRTAAAATTTIASKRLITRTQIQIVFSKRKEQFTSP